MVSAILHGARVLALPARLQPGTLYFVQGPGGTFTLYLTDKLGVAAAASVEAAALPAAVLASLALADAAVQPADLTAVAFTGQYAHLVGIPATFVPSAHTHPASEINDSTAAGRTLLTAADASAQRGALGLGSAAVAAILGTVSQAGGVPTGAISEAGSNANGLYWRFASGLQICAHQLTTSGGTTVVDGALYRSDPMVWNFPASFSAAPSIHCDPASNARFGSVGSRNTTGSNFIRVFSTSSSSSEVNVNVIAVGRWF